MCLDLLPWYSLPRVRRRGWGWREDTDPSDSGVEGGQTPLCPTYIRDRGSRSSYGMELTHQVHILRRHVLPSWVTPLGVTGRDGVAGDGPRVAERALRPVVTGKDESPRSPVLADTDVVPTGSVVSCTPRQQLEPFLSLLERTSFLVTPESKGRTLGLWSGAGLGQARRTMDPTSGTPARTGFPSDPVPMSWS